MNKRDGLDVAILLHWLCRKPWPADMDQGFVPNDAEASAAAVRLLMRPEVQKAGRCMTCLDLFQSFPRKDVTRGEPMAQAQ